MVQETMFRTTMQNSNKYTSLKLFRKVSLKFTNSSDKHIELAHFDYDLTFRMYSTYIFKSNR